MAVYLLGALLRLTSLASHGTFLPLSLDYTECRFDERDRSVLRYFVWAELEFDFEMFVRRLILLYWMDLGNRVRSIIFGIFWK